MVGTDVGGREDEVKRGDKRRTCNSYVISSGVALIFINRRQTTECRIAALKNPTKNLGP
jgi:hypothetical protein